VFVHDRVTFLRNCLTPLQRVTAGTIAALEKPRLLPGCYQRGSGPGGITVPSKWGKS
jgi:hypothetical protein